MKIVKNGYSAKESLKACGAKWNAENKFWDCSNFDFEKWADKMCNPTWNGRGNARICSGVTFDEI